MKIAVISPTPTHPTIAGNRARICSLIQCLQGMGHEVHFVHVKRIPGDVVAMRRVWGERYHPISYGQPPVTRGLRSRLKRWLAGKLAWGDWYEWGLDDWYDDEASEWIRSLHITHRFDCIIVEYVFFSKALECLDESVLKVLDTHDAMTDRQRLFIANGKRPEWFSCDASEEAKGLARAHVVIAIQEQERLFFRTITDREVIRVGHVCPVVKRFAGRHGSRSIVLVVGSDNPINIDGLRWFLAEVWPAIVDRVDGATLQVAGRVADHFEDQPGVVTIGRTEDLAPVYGSAAVVINPVTYGTGLSIKSVEALAFGMPLVTTPSGGRGLEAAWGSALIVAPTSAAFADEVVHLLTDPDRAVHLSELALGFARDWTRDQMSELGRVLERRSAAGARPG